MESMLLACEAIEDYVAAFGEIPPLPLQVSDEIFASVIQGFIAKGQPVPDDYDWWAHCVTSETKI